MQEKTQHELFKIIANRIVGQWYDRYHNGSYTFSLCIDENDIAELIVSREKELYNALYTFFFCSNKSVKIRVEGVPKPYTAVIKMITDDTLILQRDNNQLDILQRKLDVVYANNIIEGL